MRRVCLAEELVDEARFVIGYHTYPHVDMADSGARCAALLIQTLRGEVDPVTRRAHRPMVVPAEAQGPEGPFGVLRAAADGEQSAGLLDVSLFPVRPWLDLPGIRSRDGLARASYRDLSCSCSRRTRRLRA